MNNKRHYRIEHDTLGEVKIPYDALWGAQTERNRQNFQISNLKFPNNYLKHLIISKKVCATVNQQLGILDSKISQVITKACDKIVSEELWDHFPLDVMQTGSGTFTNMNANEVIAHLANRILSETSKSSGINVHPNDHVNKGQSSNDIIPTAMYISIAVAVKRDLIPTLRRLIRTFDKKQNEFQDVIKIGRTHLQDAVPITLGQEFSTYRAQLQAIRTQLSEFFIHLLELPIGGTAVGTGLNAHPELADKFCTMMSKITNLAFKPVDNKFSRIAAHDELVTLSGILKTLAVALIKMGNDIRWLGSGPRLGLNELALPENEPGSSIMPGKNNPTQIEAMILACLKVIGNDTTITASGYFGGQLQLNTAKPLFIYSIHESLTLLSNAMESFRKHCLVAIKVNKQYIEQQVQRSLMLGTALTNKIGYDKAAEIAKKAYKKNKTIYEVALEEQILPEKELKKTLDLKKMV